MTRIERFPPEDHPTPVNHYCHGVKAGNRLWISETFGMTADGFVPDDAVEQFCIATDNLDGVLRAAGGRPEHIVKFQLFLTDINDRTRINPIREMYFGAHRPSSALVEVSALVAPELRVEVEAEAVLD